MSLKVLLFIAMTIALNAVMSEKRVRRSCYRVDNIVNLREVFGQRVYQPVRYNAYQCSGKCHTGPSGIAPKDFNNYAGVQILKHYKTQTEPPKFCCVPSGYQGMAVMYYDEERGTFSMRMHKDMIVTSCTCVFMNTTL